MNGISFSGLSSGLDTAAIIDQLMALERLPIQQLEDRQTVDQGKLDLVGTLEGLVKSLQGKAEGIASEEDFYSFAVNNSNPGLATIAASGGALAGTHTVDILSTSKHDRWAFDAVSSLEDELGTEATSRVVFSVGDNDYEIFVDREDSTLEGIASRINEEASDDVSASVVNVGTEANPAFQLVLAANESGADFRIEGIATTLNGLSIDYAAPTNGASNSANHLTVGSNALVEIDGLLVERTDNDFSDVIPGVSIDISGEGGPFTFSIEPDREGIKEQLGEFVEAYNDVIEFINEQNTFDPEGEGSGELFGDSLLNTVKRTISSALFDIDVETVMADEFGFSTLSLVGIDLERDGTLSIDDTKMDAKMAEDIELFADLFVDRDGFERADSRPNMPEWFQDITADRGLAEDLVRSLDQILKPQQGPLIDPVTDERLNLSTPFALRMEVFQSSIDRLNGQIEAKERRLESYEEGLVQQFAALEQIIGQLNAQGDALGAASFGNNNG